MGTRCEGRWRQTDIQQRVLKHFPSTYRLSGLPPIHADNDDDDNRNNNCTDIDLVIFSYILINTFSLLLLILIFFRRN